MRPAFRRGWAGEGKAESSPWRGPAGEARHMGAATSALGTKGQGPWCSRTTNGRRWSASLSRNAAKGRHPCTAQRRRTSCARACGPAGVRQGERQECQRVSGSAQKWRALRCAIAAGQSASSIFPAHQTPLLIVTRMGRGYRPGPH
jgi:hypothetical protein